MPPGFRHHPSNNSISRVSPEQRATTPKKQSDLLFKTSQRTSKSVIKGEPHAQKAFSLISKMEPIKELGENYRYFYLGKGNGYEVLRRVIMQRAGLKETTNTEGILFKWTQTTFGFKYHRLGRDCYCFNHFEFHRQVSNKQRLLWNMITFCESNKLNVFNYIPTTFIIDLTTGEEDLAMHSFVKFYNRNMPEGCAGTKVHSILLPKSRYTPYLSAQQLHKRSQGHFYCKPICPKTFFGKTSSYLWILKPTFMNRGRGIALFGNLSEFQKLIWKYYDGQELEDYAEKQGIGEMYRSTEQQDIVKIITDQSQDDEPTGKLEESMEESLKLQKQIKQQVKLDIKPQVRRPKQQIEQIKVQSPEKKADSPTKKTQSPTKTQNTRPQNQASGNLDVKTTDAKNQTKTQFKSEVNAQKAKQNSLRVLSFVVQKYIECPMLVNERKFDIRIWVLLTHNYEIYMFREGYLRFSSHKYSTDNHTNPFIHLTNNSVQKYCNQYNESSGNQITLTQLQDHIQNQTVYCRIQAKIREIIWLAMCSARRKININGRKECFQLFGFDFMLDEALKVWLIQINSNPAIDEMNPVGRMLIPRMLDDMFQLTIDRICHLKYQQDRQTFPVKGFPDNQNMWQLLGDYKQGANEKALGKRMSLVRR